MKNQHLHAHLPEDPTAKGFHTSLRTELINCTWFKSKWKLTHPLIYTTHATPTPELIYVPSGFITDFASVPRIPLVYVFAGSIGHAPSVVHDYLYATHKYSKSLCDKIFYEALRCKNVNIVLASTLYIGVTLGGHIPYYKHTPEKENT